MSGAPPPPRLQCPHTSQQQNVADTWFMLAHLLKHGVAPYSAHHPSAVHQLLTDLYLKLGRRKCNHCLTPQCTLMDPDGCCAPALTQRCCFCKYFPANNTTLVCALGVFLCLALPVLNLPSRYGWCR